MNQDRTYPLDSNHLGIRLVALASLVVGALIGFVVGSLLIDLIEVNSIPTVWGGVIGAITLGFGFSYLVEKRLRSVWPSGRWLATKATQIVLQENDGRQTVLVRDQPIELMRWYFVVPRRRASVPNGWHCVACRLAQDGKAITLYTIIDPRLAETMPHWSKFERLYPRQNAKPYELSTQTTSDDQIEFRQAERARWESGAEMQPYDFTEVMTMIGDHNVHPVESETPSSFTSSTN